MSAALVDTHIALWALGDPGRLTDHERAVLTDPAVDRCLSPMSIWEAAIKRELGRLRAPRDLSTVLAGEFRLLTVSAGLLERAAELPRHHGDPFDRVLIAHALLEDMDILSRDATFLRYGVRLR